MKKSCAFVLVLIISLISATGCSQNPGQTTTQQQHGTTGIEQSVGSTGETPGQNADSTRNALDTSKFIGVERAKEIALERAGISADGVVFDRIELDRDNGIWQYELDFRQGRNEYDADIKADDGTILSFESDYDD